VLAANRVERATGARASHPRLLTNMVFDETGERLTPTYAVKKGIAPGGIVRFMSNRLIASNRKAIPASRRAEDQMY
jgi:hypothetical protein